MEDSTRRQEVQNLCSSNVSDALGDFPLHHAVKTGDFKLVQLLSQKGNFQENFLGFTPLDLAMQVAIKIFHADRMGLRDQFIAKCVTKDVRSIINGLTPSNKRTLAQGEEVSKAW